LIPPQVVRALFVGVAGCRVLLRVPHEVSVLVSGTSGLARGVYVVFGSAWILGSAILRPLRPRWSGGFGPGGLGPFQLESRFESPAFAGGRVDFTKVCLSG
jgi:hypothetical protein